MKLQYNNSSVKAEFAEVLGISPQRAYNLCSNHYSIWLLREIYCSPEVSAKERKECLEFCRNIVQGNMRYYEGLDYIFMHFPQFLASWLQFYHEEYKRYSRFFG